MLKFAKVITLLVALLHVAFFVLEVFFWDHPVGREVFRMTAEQSATSAVLAANQGVYNLMLAAGLVWGLFRRHSDLVRYLLFYIVVVGIFGGISAKFSILFTQAMPALVALALYHFSPTESEDGQ